MNTEFSISRLPFRMYAAMGLEGPFSKKLCRQYPFILMHAKGGWVVQVRFLPYHWGFINGAPFQGTLILTDLMLGEKNGWFNYKTSL